MRLLLCFFIVISFLLSFNAPAKDIVIQGSQRTDYFVETLKQALSYSPEKNYQLQFYNQYLPKMRAFQNIANNDGIDVIAAGATLDRVKILQPIMFPILKGLFGWRIPLVSKKNTDLFQTQFSNLAFKQLTLGQLHSWSDTKVLESNGLHVEKGSNYQGLFEMLAADRFDYFPRSILEVKKEYIKHKDMGIVIDKNILIHYPSAYFFYVNNNNQALANDIKYGLEQSLADGSFDRLFNKYYGKTVNQILSENRRVYQLDNPFLPKNTPLYRKELWLSFASKNN